MWAPSCEPAPVGDAQADLAAILTQQPGPPGRRRLRTPETALYPANPYRSLNARLPLPSEALVARGEGSFGQPISSLIGFGCAGRRLTSVRCWRPLASCHLPLHLVYSIHAPPVP